MISKELGQQPAFPTPESRRYGMTLRQHIAVEMMKALVGNGAIPSDKQMVAAVALDYADALLEQLAKDRA